MNLYCSSPESNCFIHCNLFGTDSTANNCPNSLSVRYWTAITTATPSSIPTVEPSVNPTAIPTIDPTSMNTTDVIASTSISTTSEEQVAATNGTVTLLEKTETTEGEAEDEEETLIGEFSVISSIVLIVCMIVCMVCIGLIIGVTICCYRRKAATHRRNKDTFMLRSEVAASEEEQEQEQTKLNSNVDSHSNINTDVNNNNNGDGGVIGKTNVNLNLSDTAGNDDDDDDDDDETLNKIAAIALAIEHVPSQEDVGIATETATSTKRKSKSKTKRTKKKKSKLDVPNNGGEFLHSSQESEMNDQIAEELFTHPNGDTPDDQRLNTPQSFETETGAGVDIDLDDDDSDQSEDDANDVITRNDTLAFSDGEADIEMTNVKVDDGVIQDAPPLKANNVGESSAHAHKSIGL